MENGKRDELLEQLQWKVNNINTDNLYQAIHDIQRSISELIELVRKL